MVGSVVVGRVTYNLLTYLCSLPNVVVNRAHGAKLHEAKRISTLATYRARDTRREMRHVPIWGSGGEGSVPR